MSRRIVSARPVWMLGALAWWIAPLSAQSVDTSAAAHASAPAATPHAIRWYEAAAAVAGVSALALVDEPLQRHAQRHRSQTSDDVASVFRRMGQPEVYGTVSLGVLTVGLLSHNRELTRSGGRLVASVGLAGATTLALKTLTGRARPNAGLGAFDFDPFSSSDALPSGHSALAFALATSLSDEIHTTWVSIALYTAATGTAFSRINDNQHWLSDVGLGALVGVTSAKLVSGRWQVFGIRPPHFLVSPSGAATIGWHASF